MQPSGTHAAVLGAGIAGLLAARVLSEAYQAVTIVDRDELPPPAVPRRGVPQGRHGHALMPGGAVLLEQLCPGLTGQLLRAGAVSAEPLADYRFQVGGRQLRPVPIGARAVQATRPFLEAHLAQWVAALPNVAFAGGCDVTGLLDAGGRIAGVRILRRARGSAEETLAADLVVDATGRGSRAPAWLAALGYERPAEDRPRVDVSYASRLLRLPDGDAVIEKTVGIGPVPGRPRGMILVAVENGLRMLTVVGFGPAHRPPNDPGRLGAWTACFAPPDVQAAILAADPVGGVATYRYLTYQRRRYERMPRLPGGLLAVGDALCSFSPVYAQGMTVAAQQAVVLRGCLAAGAVNLPARFFRAAARTVDAPWRAATAADLALPEVDGPRPVPVRLLNRYVSRVLAAAERDDAVSRTFMRVTALLDPPSALLAPGTLRRVVRPWHS